MKSSSKARRGTGTDDALADVGHERVSLPSDDSLWAAGVDHASKRAEANKTPILEIPMYVAWIIEKGRVLADLRGAAWSAAHRDELRALAETTAATSTATATTTEATASARESQAELDELHNRRRPAGAGLPFLPRLPMVPYVFFLIGVALGETAFNVTAFRITGEKEWFVGIMATLVGIASAMSAHLIGGPLEELTTSSPDRRGQIFVRLSVGFALAVFMISGLVAVAHLRADYLDVAQKATTASVSSTDTIALGDQGRGEELPQIGLIAPLALNLMVWVVAIGAAYNHASVHHSVDAKLARRYRRATKKNRKARGVQAAATADQITDHEGAAHATRAAIADVQSLTDLVNAKTLLYAAAFCSVLDQHDIEHFGTDAIPTLDLPDWAKEAKKLLAEHEHARDKQLEGLNGHFASEVTAALRPRVLPDGAAADPGQRPPTRLHSDGSAA